MPDLLIHVQRNLAYITACNAKGEEFLAVHMIPSADGTHFIQAELVSEWKESIKAAYGVEAE